ncbi:hypothetical protein BKG59_05775 [Mycobacteroides chelonae]|nr:hypothetical protein BKG63_24360 [Mycobacteroides chelonae]OHT99599.1 hypothetical protein BKG72_04030 [Mycobacteroides chelonae]OLT92939.1 hypothetical protein BKG59_05775 [Mycobacteroides chelonae]
MPEAYRELEEFRDKYAELEKVYLTVCRELNRYMGLLDNAEKDILALIDERDSLSALLMERE